MGKINVLSFEVANLIAAGEVVDRPASCIKELVENSIDAGAGRITVELQRGGILYMRVTDNGCGIDPEDLPIAVRRHATSKIREASDLSAIMTLGFRGEALAAICSVADVRIISKVRGAEYGAAIEVNSGRVGPVTERGASEGTTVIVENLFSNVPARLKFLKRDQTEGMAACSVVEKIAMSHPEIAFKVISDGSVKLETPGDGRLITVLKAVYGKDFASKLMPVGYDSEAVSVKGYITSPEAPRANRNYQNFFINGRYVKTRTASAALEQAYTSYIPTDKFPGCILSMEIIPQAVDVNVHPSKLEVKFSDERPVFDAVYRAVRDTLLTNTRRPGSDNKNASEEEIYASSVERKVQTGGNTSNFFSRTDAAGFKSATSKQGFGFLPPVSGAFVPVTDREDRKAYSPEQLKIGETAQESPASSHVEYTGDRNDSRREAESAKTGSVDSNYAGDIAPMTVSDKKWRIVGEVFNTYVIYEEEGSVTVFDKHAVHERIIFEKLRRGLNDVNRPSVLLAVPVEFGMTREEISFVEENRESIEKTGFSFETAEGAVSVSAVPDGISVNAVEEMFQVFADRTANGTGTVELTGLSVFEKKLYQASCKAAIKGGRVYPGGYIEWLVSEMHRIPEVTYCPHGRPVAYIYKKSDFDRLFDRI